MQTMIKKILLFLIVLGCCSSAFSQTRINMPWQIIQGVSTVAGKPASPLTGTVWVVTDGTGATPCATGGGSTYAWCYYTGAVWVSVGGGGGSGSGTISAGTTGQFPYYTGIGTTVGPDTGPSTDGLGNWSGISSITMSGASHLIDIPEQAAPANPSAGNDRLYANSTSHTLKCLTSSGGDCLPTAATGTKTFAFQGVCQAGVASASINLPVTNSPTYVSCDATHITAEWQVPASNTNNTFMVRFTVPTGQTGNYTLVTKLRSAAIAGIITLQPQYACVTAGQVPDNPTFVNLGGTIPVTVAGVTLQNVTTTTTGLNPTCAAGADLYVNFTITANTVASPVNFSYVSLSTQAAL